jgi:uracil phosphoribosyltransferase
MKRFSLNASDLDGVLAAEDRETVGKMGAKYEEALALFKSMPETGDQGLRGREIEKLIDLYNELGAMMHAVTSRHPNVHVYSFETPDTIHGEASRLIAKLRDVRTGRAEFVYYVQRAYELLFNFAFVASGHKKKNYIVVRTPVTLPVKNYAVHKIPDIDDRVTNSVMCVLLRGALLPSMILSKEVEEFTSKGYLTPFALFRISRNDRKVEGTMEYTLRLDRSYFDIDALDGRDLFFADPMNATGGSLITVVRYLLEHKVKPRSIKTFNIVSALKGTLRIVRGLENVEVYTLWMDPVLNRKAYILPGLGDAGDRINGPDKEEYPRDIIQLIADYGSSISSLYRSQVREIENTVLRAIPEDSAHAIEC